MCVCRTEAQEEPESKAPRDASVAYLGRAAPDTREKLHCALSWPHELQPEQEPAWSPWNRPARSVLAPFPGMPF